MKRMLEVTNVLCLWGSYYDDPEFKPILEALKSANKKVWMYYCNTSLRSALYRYYRMHAWKGLQQQNPVLGLFVYLNGPGGYYGRSSWKTCSEGGLIYNSLNEPVTSIRYECLREGFNDIRYMKKLAECIATAKAKGVQPELIDKAASFLEQAPFDVVIKQPHDTNMAQSVKDKAAEFIMKIQQTTERKKIKK